MWYRSGTVSVTNGSAVVVGTGTLWLSQAKVGDVFTVDGATWYEIQAITDDTHLTLQAVYAGTTDATANYAIIRNFNSSTAADIASSLSLLMNKYHLTLDEMVAWLTETGDVVLTDALGIEHTVPSVNKIGAMIGTQKTKDVAGSTASYTLTAAEASAVFLVFTGARTANAAIVFPNSVGLFGVYNSTSGAYTLTVKTAAGTGIAVTQGKRTLLYCDGVNIVVADNDTALAGFGDSATKNVGTAAGTVAAGDHAHPGVYEPADATLLKVSASGKTTPVDADYMVIRDSEDSSIWKRLTWANVKEALKTYFDSLYAVIGHTHDGYAASDHNHTGTYEPADDTILKDADIGTSVQAYDADIATVAASQAEMEAGTETALRSMSPLRVAQAIAELGGAGAGGDFLADGSVPMTGDLQLSDNDIIFEGSTSGVLTLKAAAVTTDYTLTFPANDGDANQLLQTDGSGNTSWVNPATGGGSGGGFKNKIINGRFQINQRGYVSGATLAAGAYGHDRWKAGASGGDYSFTQNAADTTITIASGKSLIQVIEAGNVSDTAFVLSWSGTAQARYAVDSATPSGSYAASPILISGQTVGTTMSVEFNAGTLGDVQLEAGSVATPFEARNIGIETTLCLRYAVRFGDGTAYYIPAGYSMRVSTNIVDTILPLPVRMRAAPTYSDSGWAFAGAGPSGNQVGFYNNNTPGYATATGAVTGSCGAVSTDSVLFRLTAGTSFSGTSGDIGNLYFGTTAFFILSAEL